MARLVRWAVWGVAAAVVVSTAAGFMWSLSWTLDLLANFRMQIANRDRPSPAITDPRS